MDTERPRLAALFVLLLALAQPSSIVAQAFPDQPVDEVGWCRAFLSAFFPEFQQAQTSVDTFGHNYTFTIRAFASPDTSDNDAPAAPFAAVSTFKFRKDKLLSEWFPDKHPSQLVQMQTTVASHPDWGERRIKEEMQAAGARFLPGDAPAVEQVLWNPDTRALFGDIRLQDVDFLYGNSQDPAAARLYRRGEIVVMREGKAHRTYAFLADPFTGKLLRFALLWASPPSTPQPQ